MLVSIGRLAATQSPEHYRRRLKDTSINEVPLTGDSAILASALEGLPGDPADRFIVATAIAHDATLITADKALLTWKNKLPRQNATK